MFKMVERDAGQKKYKPSDLTKAMHGAVRRRGWTRRLCKDAIRELVDSGRLVYTYFGGTYLEVPHREGAAND